VSGYFAICPYVVERQPLFAFDRCHYLLKMLLLLFIEHDLSRLVDASQAP
jgi:hypothetical protein